MTQISFNRRKRKLKQRSAYQTQKRNTDAWCSRYIRLRYMRPDRTVKCVTCGAVHAIERVQAGHFIGRGMGGSSGVYFDERNIHPQCVLCNGFRGGMPKEYEAFMLETYGQAAVDRLRVLHKVNSYSLEQLVGLELYFKTEVERLLKENHMGPWW